MSQLSSLTLSDRPQALRVLIVRETSDPTDALAVDLEQRGHDVRTVSSAAKAMRVAIELRPNVAVVDIEAGDAAAYALARQLRMLPGLEQLRLIATTNMPMPEFLAESAVAGADFLHRVSSTDSVNVFRQAIEDGRAD